MPKTGDEGSAVGDEFVRNFLVFNAPLPAGMNKADIKRAQQAGEATQSVVAGNALYKSGCRHNILRTTSSNLGIVSCLGQSVIIPKL